ncbi:hypothetical protein [Pontibacter sp. SGAir0037]|uniref:hypothetical protein n=1 Tax=Pontibacter sp. SGAir0037 TaxID=2571030 RepID=UPI0010CCF94D|nr:hypothetical protein [Pontibacter sp. SGAir0037]QCR23151.1 hypothetical protein C1N53_12895 [Pontibacter sp. SGAir0037]
MQLKLKATDILLNTRQERTFMILYSDGHIEMDYDVSHDILTARWLDYKGASKQELQYSIERLISTIKSYDIRNLLIDAHEDVTGITDEEYLEVNQEFGKSLTETRLQKIARLGSPNEKREDLVEELAEDILEKTEVKIIFQNFYDRPSAISWLQKG